jgi:hypothetical protein
MDIFSHYTAVFGRDKALHVHYQSFLLFFNMAKNMKNSSSLTLSIFSSGNLFVMSLLMDFFSLIPLCFGRESPSLGLFHSFSRAFCP